MRASDLKDIKAAIKKELLRRNGYGSVASYGSSTYDFVRTPTVGQPIYKEFGEKTVDLLLKITDYKDLKPTKTGELIPTAFNREIIDFVNNTLAKEKFTGESTETVANLFPDRVPETSSCRGACTGLCVGSCINQCNGCTGCTASCGTGCASGCNSTCSGGSMAYSGY